MKRFLSRSSRKSSTDKDEEIPDNTIIQPIASNQSGESHDSLKDLTPIFNSRQASSTTTTSNMMMNLNLNPTISNATEFSKVAASTKGSTIHDSLFSSRQSSYSTNPSSYASAGSGGGKSYFSPSKPLQTLNVVKETDGDDDEQTWEDRIRENLKQLYQDLAYIMNQYNNSTINLSTAVIDSIDCLKKFTQDNVNEDNGEGGFSFDTYNSSSLRKIFKIYLHFYDNLLNSQVYIKLKLLLVKNFNDFIMVLNPTELTNNMEMIKPKNFAIGSNENQYSLPNEDVLMRIIDKISHNHNINSSKDQNGSFIAPITRGISSNLNILCLYFGYPDPQEYHYNLIQGLRELYDDIHIILTKNQIELAASNTTTDNQQHQQQHQQKFKLPFRIPTDNQQIPISMSISIENAVRTSGTMGGYIYPIIDLTKQPHLKSYANSKFAISCGHVCLDSMNPENYPNVASPSSVLISLYKQALTEQYHKCLKYGKDDSKVVAYRSILNQLEEMFPLKKIKSSQNKNLPKHRFGQIIWGERTLLQINQSTTTPTKNEISGVVEKKLSDLAIIKVNKNLKCQYNYLGDDVLFTEYDPGLIFDNLYIRKVLSLKRYIPKPINTNIEDIDSNISSSSSSSSSSDGTYYGIPVFKYGSTTKYTKGYMNGIKLVYWLDGAIHSSEFIVNSIDNNSTFASGGDSGSWILTKLGDQKGLGVLGMLHSYDGEFKQFGLFSPMTEILNRLEEVTNIKWGVVGCENYNDDGDYAKHDQDMPHDGESESECEHNNAEKLEFSDTEESTVSSDADDGAYPPYNDIE
ncbi:SSY5 SPS-sensor serine protease component SSY5 [Candida maltosa Xu316]